MHSPQALLQKARRLSTLLYQDMEMHAEQDPDAAADPDSASNPVLTLQACSVLKGTILSDLGVKYIEPRPSSPLMLRLRSQMAMVMATLTGGSLPAVPSDEVVPKASDSGPAGSATQTTLRALHQHMDTIPLSVAGPDAAFQQSSDAYAASRGGGWCL